MTRNALCGHMIVFLLSILVVSGCSKNDNPLAPPAGDDLPPVPLAQVATFTPNRYEPLFFNAAASHDENGDYTEITQWEWDWDNDGSYDQTGAVIWHYFTTPGIHHVQLRVTDDEGDTATLASPLEFTLPPADFVVEFPDSYLEDRIRSAVDVPEPDDIMFSDLEGLESLQLFLSGVTDLTGLNYCIDLTWLGLQYCQIEDLRPLMTLSRLDYLFTINGPFWDLDPLSHCTELTFLWLENQDCRNIAPLRHCTKLTELIYIDQIACEGFEQLGSLTRLEHLRLDGYGVTTTASLSQMTSMVNLDIGGNPVGDLGFTNHMPNLLHLQAPDCAITNPTPAFANALLTIDLSDNPLNGITSIAGVTSLTHIRLNNSGLTNLAAINGLPNLIEVGLSDNPLTSITALTSLPSIDTIWLRNCQLTDICPLLDLAGLAYDPYNADSVFLEGNPLSSNSVDVCIPVLQDRGINVHHD